MTMIKIKVLLMALFGHCRAFLIVLVVVGIIPALAASRSGAGKGPILAILPLAVHAEQDFSYLADGVADMLGSRIASHSGALVLGREDVRAALAGDDRPVDRAMAESAGASLGADYVLFGSITRLGRALSLDIHMVDMAGEKDPAVFHRGVEVIDEIISAIDALAEAIYRSVFVSAAGKTGTEVVPSPSADPEAVDDRGSNIIRSRDDQRGSGFWRSRDLEMEIRGLAVADLSGDGKNEIVLLAGNYLSVQRLEKDRFYQLAERRAARHEQFLAVDAVDTDGNGKAEIFVSAININSGRPASLVLELSPAGLSEVARGQIWFFRTMGETDRIFGQKKGRPDAFTWDVSGVFSSDIRRLEREGAEYVPRERVRVPGDFSLFAVTRGVVRGLKTNDHIVVDNNGRVRLYDDRHRLLWAGTDNFAGSETYLTAVKDSDSGIGRRVYLPQRVQLTEAGASGRKTIIAVSHTAGTGRLFARFRQYSQSSFVGLTWDGLGLTEAWRTRPVSGYIADFALADLNNDGRRELIGGVVMSRDAVFSKSGSCVVRYIIDDIE